MLPGVAEYHDAGPGYEENLWIGLDFSDRNEILLGQTLTGTPIVSLDVDPDGLMAIVAGPTIVDDVQVLWKIRRTSDGLAGALYTYRCRVALTGGSELVEELSVRVQRN